MTTTNSVENYPSKVLGDGLVLRWSTAADTEKIATLTGHVFRGKAEEPPNVRMMDQMRVIMRGDHPFMTPHDFAVIEDTSKPDQPIVACTCLWQHRWCYGGIAFTAGRPEFVASLPDYRNRGLIRQIFNLIHERSDARGDLMQGITGIPYFYRQFGYEMVLDLGGNRGAPLALIPALKEGEREPFTLRPATVDDVALLTTLHAQSLEGNLIWQEVDEAYWRYLVTYWEDPASRYEDRLMVQINIYPHMIIDPTGTVMGSVTFGHHRWGKALGVFSLGLAEEANLQTIMPSLLRALRDYGLQAPAFNDDAPPLSELRFGLGRNHPLYALMGQRIAPVVEPPYAWYIRMPDVPAFLRHVAPVLEARLAASALRGYTGEIKFDLYRGGLQLVFEKGKLMNADQWRPPTFGDHATAGSPPLLLLQLILGYRSRAELQAIFPDFWTEEAAHLLLDTLFPKQPSHLMPMA